MSYKSDFPLFQTYPDLVYLDNAATVQKPQAVLDAVNHFLVNDYSNVHRGVYDLSQQSEEVFWQCRKTVAQWMGCRDDEVVFTAGTTTGMNMLTASLHRSKRITSESIMVLSK
jgi:selenocysteine lyase/cysteine desulfurase